MAAREEKDLTERSELIAERRRELEQAEEDHQAAEARLAEARERYTEVAIEDAF